MANMSKTIILYLIKIMKMLQQLCLLKS